MLVLIPACPTVQEGALYRNARRCQVLTFPLLCSSCKLLQQTYRSPYSSYLFSHAGRVQISGALLPCLRPTAPAVEYNKAAVHAVGSLNRTNFYDAQGALQQAKSRGEALSRQLTIIPNLTKQIYTCPAVTASTVAGLDTGNGEAATDRNTIPNLNCEPQAYDKDNTILDSNCNRCSPSSHAHQDQQMVYETDKL